MVQHVLPSSPTELSPVSGQDAGEYVSADADSGETVHHRCRSRHRSRPATEQWIEIEALTHQRRQTINRPAEIRAAGRQVDANRRRERQHAERTALTAARTRSADAPARTWRRSPLFSTISITGSVSAAATYTGTNVARGVTIGGISVAANFRRQYQNVHGDDDQRQLNLPAVLPQN
jgi:hypothetical protein